MIIIGLMVFLIGVSVGILVDKKGIEAEAEAKAKGEFVDAIAEFSKIRQEVAEKIESLAAKIK